MYSDTVDHFADVGKTKLSVLMRSPLAFLVGAMMAGAYIGFGDILMLTVGAHVDPAYAHLIMGAVFACALTFVVFAGAELFTGMAMYMPCALFKGKSNVTGMILVWVVCWIGNLLGCAILAYLLNVGGGGVLLGDGSAVFFKVVVAKMSGTGPSLLARGVLCNWLVCLAIWMCARTKSDGAKLGLIFWAIFVFVACGFEHSVANMFVFTLALIAPHPAEVTLAGALHNLLWVTLGNLIGGAIFIAFGYWVQNRATPSAISSPVTGAATRG